MSDYKQCPIGHYYQGDNCPYCKLDTSVVHQETESEVANIPHCPHCGKPVRKVLPHVFNIGSIEGYAYDGKTPWNYNWNGCCENCGHDFSITMTQKIDSPHNDRQTIVRVSQRQVQAMSEEGDIFLDAFVGLSGVEIEQRNNVDGVKTIFMSTNELKYLVDALKNSPLLEQLDFCADWT